MVTFFDIKCFPVVIAPLNSSWTILGGGFKLATHFDYTLNIGTQTCFFFFFFRKTMHAEVFYYYYYYYYYFNLFYFKFLYSNVDIQTNVRGLGIVGSEYINPLLDGTVTIYSHVNYSKIPILRPPLGLSKSGLKDHFWTVPKVVSNQRYIVLRK